MQKYFIKNASEKDLPIRIALRLMRERNYYAAMMVEHGDADALVSGLTKDYPKTILPSLQTIGTADGVNRVAGMYIIINKRGTFFFADTTVNVDPNCRRTCRNYRTHCAGCEVF